MAYPWVTIVLYASKELQISNGINSQDKPGTQ